MPVREVTRGQSLRWTSSSARSTLGAGPYPPHSPPPPQSPRVPSPDWAWACAPQGKSLEHPETSLLPGAPLPGPAPALDTERGLGGFRCLKERGGVGAQMGLQTPPWRARQPPPLGRSGARAATSQAQRLWRPPCSQRQALGAGSTGHHRGEGRLLPRKPPLENRATRAARAQEFEAAQAGQPQIPPEKWPFSHQAQLLPPTHC